MKVRVSITAHISIEPCNEEVMVIFTQDYESHDFLPSAKWPPFLYWLAAHFPLLNWEFDDGYDADETNYCQYVSYTEGIDSIGNYVLATLDVVE